MAVSKRDGAMSLETFQHPNPTAGMTWVVEFPILKVGDDNSMANLLFPNWKQQITAQIFQSNIQHDNW